MQIRKVDESGDGVDEESKRADQRDKVGRDEEWYEVNHSSPVWLENVFGEETGIGAAVLVELEVLKGCWTNVGHVTREWLPENVDCGSFSPEEKLLTLIGQRISC